jgi:hypothetical protein
VETGLLGNQVIPSCVERLGFWDIDGDTVFILCCRCLGNQSRSLVYFLFPLDVRPLKAAYSW